MKSLALPLLLAGLSFAAPSPAASIAPPAGHPPVGKAAASQFAAPVLNQTGTVMSVIDAPGYTYIQVKQGDKSRWLAAQTVAVKKGDAIRFDDGAPMGDFYSKSLKRTFPEITFVDQVVNAASLAGHPPVGNARAASQLAAARLPQKGKVMSVINAPGYTYIEVRQGDKTHWLAAQTVAVKKGDAIRFDDGAMMHNFYSKTLNRTFPEVIFVSAVAVGK